MSAHPTRPHAVSMATVDGAIELVAREIGGSAWSEALRFHEVDLFDAARSPVFVDLLAAARAPERQAPRRSGRTAWSDRLRRYAIDRQVPRPVVEWRARRRSHPPAVDAVLAWPREPTHLAVLRPVVTELAVGGRAGYIVCQPRLFDQLADDASSPALTRAEWPDLVRRAETSVAPMLDRLDEPLELGGTARVLGLSPARLERVLRRTLTRQLPTIVETVLATERIVDELVPRALVVGNDLTIEGRAAALTARVCGLPTAAIMHGAVTGDPLQRHHVVDRFLVHGRRSARTLEAHGCPLDRVVVTGDPRLAERPTPSQATDPRVAELAGLETGEPWLLVASSGPGHRTSLEHHRHFVSTIEALARTLSDVRIVVKLHRKDRVEHYPRAAPFAVVPHDPSHPGILAWLRGPSLVITGASTVAVEAMLMRIPVVTIDLADALSRVDFIEVGATIHCRTEAEAVRRVRETLERGGAPDNVVERAEAFVDETFAHVGDDPAARAADAIRELASVNPTSASSSTPSSAPER